MARAWYAALALLLLVVPGAAAARNVVWGGGSLDLLLTTKKTPGQDAVTFSPLLHIDAVHTSGFGLSAEWGLAATRVTSGGGESMGRVAAGNPVLSVSKDLSTLAGIPLQVGLGVVFGVGLPSSLESARAARDALAYAAAGRGLWSAWDWLPITFGVVVPFTLDELRMGAFGVAADGALAWALRSSRAEPAAGSNAPDLFGQLAVTGLAHIDPAAFGLRLQVVAFDTGSPSHAELAAAPFAAIDAGPVSIGARVLLPLAGPSASTARWSTQLTVAGRF